MAHKALPSLEELTYEIAAEHVCTRVPVAASTARLGDVRRAIERQHYDSATHLAICDNGRLKGIMTIETLLAAPDETIASAVMDTRPPRIAPKSDQEMAVRQAILHNESTVAVVDAEDTFIGLIPPHRLLAILLYEHEEDMNRLGGFLHDSSAARTASLEAVARRFWHRIPWLILGLVGALVAADIMGAFEAQLQATVTLAFFIPGIVYLADAVGTQTETLVVRGLSVGVSIGDVIIREVLTGLLIGLALSLIFFPLAWWRWGDQQVALAVSLSLLAACSLATVIALALPWLFQRFGKDPAFGTGPLATVIQDLLSILIYFVIASALVH